MEKEEMKTTNEITDIILKMLVEKSFPVFLTTFSGQGFYEADVFGINKNGYMSEFEIKRSRSDFFNDFKNKEHKHQRLSTGDSFKIYDEWKNGKKTGEQYTALLIPNRFYFVCEAGLVDTSEIPSYAGHIIITGNNFIEIKKAPLLHKNKANQRIYERIAIILSQRIIFGCSYYTHLHKKGSY